MNSLEFPKRSVSRMNQIQPNLLQSKMLPVGIENFEEIRTEGYYYIDKAGTIKSLLTKRSKLLFFEIGCDPSLFAGLEISK